MTVLVIIVVALIFKPVDETMIISYVKVKPTVAVRNRFAFRAEQLLFLVDVLPSRVASADG